MTADEILEFKLKKTILFSTVEMNQKSKLSELISIPCHYKINFIFNYNTCFQDLVQALYDFTPQEPGELAFSRGDVITVTDKTDQHWWRGEIGNRDGLFPATYVQPYHQSY